MTAFSFARFEAGLTQIVRGQTVELRRVRSRSRGANYSTPAIVRGCAGRRCPFLALDLFGASGLGSARDPGRGDAPGAPRSPGIADLHGGWRLREGHFEVLLRKRQGVARRKECSRGPGPGRGRAMAGRGGGRVPVPVIPATRSGASRPPIPVDSGHPFRSKPATPRSEATLGGFSRSFQLRLPARRTSAAWMLLSG
jgi:hypothetical protein